MFDQCGPGISAYSWMQRHQGLGRLRTQSPLAALLPHLQIVPCHETAGNVFWQRGCKLHVLPARQPQHCPKSCCCPWRPRPTHHLISSHAVSAHQQIAWEKSAVHFRRQARFVYSLTWSSNSMVASSHPCMGILRCESRVVMSLDLAASACCPCWTYAGDTRLLAKVRLAEFILRTASYIPHSGSIHAKGAGCIRRRCSDHHSARLQATTCMPAVREWELAEWLQAFARKVTTLMPKSCRHGVVRGLIPDIRMLACMQKACNACVFC